MEEVIIVAEKMIAKTVNENYERKSMNGLTVRNKKVAKENTIVSSAVKRIKNPDFKTFRIDGSGIDGSGV